MVIRTLYTRHVHAFLIIVLILAGSTWIGGIPALYILRIAGQRSIGRGEMVKLFRAVGRIYGSVTSIALAIAIISGWALAGDPENWANWQIICALLAAALIVITGLGVHQARGITRRRQAALDSGTSPEAALRRTIKFASYLRAVIALVSVGIVVAIGIGIA